MADGIRIEVKGTEQGLLALGEIAQRTANPRGLWAAIGVSLESSTQQHFLDESGPGGSVWPPSLRARMEGGKTLTDTARLMQSLTSNVTDDGVEHGTNVLYAAVHQFGATITAKTSKGLRFKTGRGANAQWATKQSVTIPARPFLGIDADDETRILLVATDWLAGEAGDAA
jgi:phage virion morphogenesis protein